jgi:hypothetical protein
VVQFLPETRNTSRHEASNGERVDGSRLVNQELLEAAK